jgi:hypothetical protein
MNIQTAGTVLSVETLKPLNRLEHKTLKHLIGKSLKRFLP